MGQGNEQDRLVNSYLEAAGLGTVQRALPLKGTVVLPGGQEAPARLCQTTRGLYVAGAASGDGQAIDALTAFPRGYDHRVLGDRLTLGQLTFGVPYGKGAEARLLIGAGTLACQGLVAPVDAAPPRGPWIEELRPIEIIWLAASLGKGEIALAWLTSSTATTVESPFQRDAAPEWRFVLTTERALLLAITEVGDVLTVELPRAPLALTVTGRRGEVAAGEALWRTALGNLPHYEEVAPVVGLDRADRMRSAAARATGNDPAFARQLLVGLLPEGDPIDVLALQEVDARATAQEPPALDPTELEALAALRTSDPDSARLAAWFADWNVSALHARRLLDAAMHAASGPSEAGWALDLHRSVRARVVGNTDDLIEQTEADVALAEHLVFAGHHAEAAAMLELRLAALPDEDLVEVLPEPGADLTDGDGGQPLHLRVLELIVAARAGMDAIDVSALAGLARNQPLVIRRIDALAQAATGDLKRRAEVLLHLLAPGPETPQAEQSSPATETAVVQALHPEAVVTLRHPVARHSGAFGRMQAFLARVEPPDVGVLRQYCERVGPRRHPVAASAVADASVMLGLPVVPAFVSMGETRVGVRSHEEPEPMLLIGGAHLDPEADEYLRPEELLFAVGAEVAHLRFHHSRVTSHEVWNGLWARSTTAIGVAAAFLPFLKYLPTEVVGRSRVAHMVETLVPSAWLDRVYGAEDGARVAALLGDDVVRLGEAGVVAAGGTLARMRDMASRLVPSEPHASEDLGTDDARLVAAHRVMQITADRAGLVLCGDLRGAVRAMHLTHSRLQPELALATREGLATSLGRKDAEGYLLFPHIAVRVAALSAFWLSDDYVRLRNEMHRRG